MAAVASPAEPFPTIPARIVGILREVVRGYLAGALAGLAVGGLGGRIVMRIAAMLNPDATGRLTEAGEVVGAITVSGTLALMIFGGLLAGLLAGIVWVIVSSWIPFSGWRRRLLAAVLTVSTGGFFLVQADNRDFAILGPDGLLVGLLLSLVALLGAAIAWLDEVLERRLPRASARPTAGLVLYGVLAVPGLLLVPLMLNSYLSGQSCSCSNPPERIGWAIIAAGTTTAVWWVIRIVTGRADPPTALLAAGRIALAAAVVAGVAYLAPEVADILAPS